MNRRALWGMLVWVALAGGLKTDAQPVTTIYSFIHGPATPRAGLTLGNDGNFYGSTAAGGFNNEGTLFKLTTNGTMTTLVNFSGYGNGSVPVANLLLGPDGNFYGATATGGTNTTGNNAAGTVFRMTTNGTVTVLVNFNGSNGGVPQAGLALGPDGNFYGTTEFGGTNGDGTVFKMTTSGTLTTLVNFNGTNGANPLASLTAGPGGSLYGTTRYGGTNGNFGTVFAVTTNGVFTTLFQFGGTNGAWPYGGVIVGPDGNLYGTTAFGGNPNGSLSAGSIFELTTNGVLTTLVSLDELAGNNGGNPYAGLTLGPDGNFYGTTYAGGVNGNGTVFQVTTNGTLAMLARAGIPYQTVINPQGVIYYTTNDWVTDAVAFNGTLTTLYSFSAQTNFINADGIQPQAGLTLGTDGKFYGTASGGGNNGYGTAFKVTTNGTFTTLASFNGNNGDNPQDALTPGPDGILYGTANTGGTSGYGTVFKLTTGGAITTLVNFDRANDGANPQAGLIVGPGGNFYGTAVGGGSNLLQTGPNTYQAVSDGTVFALTTNGIFTVLTDFNGNNGANPYGGLAVGLDGNLYGTATYGGISNDGTIFQITTNGTVTVLTNFTGANGANPFASLTLGPDGNFYGTSEAGGPDNDGTVFQVTTNGTLTTLVDFNGANGANPNAGVLLGPDGNFYGTAWGGGSGNGGTVFKVTIGGTLTTLVNFAQTNGEFPVGGLALGPDGNFYGTTELGGAPGNSGAIFKMTTNGTLTILYSFVFGTPTSPNGNYPFAGLTLMTNGNFIHFYGTTYNGGSGGGGTVFQLNLTTAYAVAENSTNTFYLLTNEVVWATGGPLSLVSAAATNGTAQIAGSGMIFKPAANFIGTASINYAVTNNAGGTNTSFITVLVTNVPPVANPDFYTVAENTGSDVLSPLTNDQLGTSGGTLGLVSVSATNGTAVISGTNVLFTPTPNFTGTATIGYTITDNVGGTNSSLITVTVANSFADLSLIASAAPQPVGVGSNLVYSLTVSNAGPAMATGVVVSNTIPANCTFVSATGGATPTNGVLLVNLGSLAEGTNVSVQVVVQPTAAGSLTNNFQVFANETDPVLANNSANLVSTVTNAPVVNQGIPGTPTASWDASSQVVIGEGGGIGVQTIMQTLAIPSFSFMATPGNIVMLINPNGGTNMSNWKAVVNFFNPSDPTGTNGLAATDYQTFFPTNAGPNAFANVPLFTNVDYVPIAATNADGSITADIVENGPAGGILAGQQAIILYTASIQPGAGADLSLSASAAPEPVGVGSSLVYSLAVSNAGPSVASGVTISNLIPVGVNFVSATGGSTPTGGVLLMNVGSLAIGAVANAQVIVQPTAAGKVTNLFQVFSSTTDPVLTNNSASVVSTVTNAAVVASADLKLSASAAPEPVGVSSNLVYSITVSNAGPSAATGVVVSNQLPAGVNFVSATGGATPASGMLLLDLGSLASNAISSVQVIIQPTVAGKLTNLFQVFSSTVDPVLTNNFATVVSTVTNVSQVNLADVSLITSSIYSSLQKSTGDWIYSITVSNAGPGTATGVVVSNQIPTNVICGGQIFNANFVSATGGATPTNDILLVNLGALAVGATNLVQVIESITQVGSSAVTNDGYMTNVFQVFADQADPIPTNNTANFLTPIVLTAVTSSTEFYDTNLTATVNQSATNYTTELIAKLPNGTVVFNQTFPVAYSDATVQSAITTAAGDLTGAGASSYTGPTETSFLQSLDGSSSVTGTNAIGTNVTTVTTEYVGQQTILVGASQTQPFFIPAGAVDYDTLVTTIVTNLATTTEFSTNLNSAVYVMTGIVAQADLKLTASAAPQPVSVGSNLVYSLTVSNAGPATATGVVVSNELPASVTFVSATGGAVPSGGILLVSLGSLAADANTSLQVVVQPTAAGRLTNLFQVFASTVDLVLTNNSATVTSTVTNGPPPSVDVALSLTAAPNPVSVGAPLTYSLTVTNNSSTTATGVVVSNTLPTDVTLFSLLSSQGTATNRGNVVTYFVGSLPNGNAATLAIVVLPEAAGLLTNLAIVTSAQTDAQPANNRATNITAVVNQPITNLVLTVLSSITLNPQTGLFEQRIGVANGGPATPSSVLVTVAGLRANAKVYNASGTTNGLPYVQSRLPLGVGSNVVFLLEYYVPTRVAPTNLTFAVRAGPIVIPPVVSGTIMSVSRTLVLPDGSVLVEFGAVPGQVYAIQYSSDLRTWLTATPAITAPANRVQWIDAGPPQTVSSPAQQPVRYYRVVLLTAH